MVLGTKCFIVAIPKRHSADLQINQEMSGPGLLVLAIAAGIGIYAVRKLQAGADATRVIDSATGENPNPPGESSGPYAPTIEHISTARKRAQKKHEMYVGGPTRHKIPTVPTQSVPIAGLVNNHD